GYTRPRTCSCHTTRTRLPPADRASQGVENDPTCNARCYRSFPKARDRYPSARKPRRNTTYYSSVQASQAAAARSCGDKAVRERSELRLLAGVGEAETAADLAIARAEVLIHRNAEPGIATLPLGIQLIE